MSGALQLGKSAVYIAKPNTTTPLQLKAGEYMVRTSGEPIYLAEGGQQPTVASGQPAFLVDNYPVKVFLRTGTVQALNPAGTEVPLFWSPLTSCGCKGCKK